MQTLKRLKSMSLEIIKNS